MAYRDTPTVVNGILHTDRAQRIKLDTPEWFAWLETTIAFSYASQAPGVYRLHLRKRRRRNCFYWYAHLKIDRKLYNAYAGASTQLTTVRLEEVSQKLFKKIRKATG